MSASNKRPVAGSRSPARSNNGADAGRRMRMGLLGSTALIAAGLACTPVFAQTTIATPAGGGTITRTGGSSTTDDQTGAGGGILISNVTQAATTAVNGVTINNTTGTPSADALRIQGTVSLASTGVSLTGVNTLTTTVNGGSALYVQTSGNMGVGITSSGSVFTGSYGINLQAPSGYVSFNAAGQSQSFVANGSHIAGFNAVTGVNASIELGSSTFTGFDTGINASNFYGTFVEMTGGSINALVTGIRTDATGGGSTIESQAAIVAPTGIHSTNTTGALITTSGAGTINSTSNGVGTGIIATSSGGDNLGTFAINVGAAIGNVTAFATGVDLSTTGSSTNSINLTTTAAITATARAISVTAGTFGNAGTLSIGANVTGATGLYTNVGNYAVNIAAGATVTSTGNTSSNAALYLVNGTNTVTNDGALIASGTGSHGVHFSSDGLVTNTATGTISGSSGIWYQNVASVNNAGTITGTGAANTAGVYGSSGASVTNTGTITGYDGVYSGGNPTTHNNTGGTITGVAHGYNVNGGRVTLTNTGVINTAGGTGGAGLSGLRLNTTGSPNTITNSGTITGGGDATYGYGVEILDGAVTLTNQSGGVISGGIGGIWVNSDDLATINLNLGSTVTGQILSGNTGARTATVAGLLDGAYNAAGGSGVDTITLASTGSITGAVTLGAGDDVFNWQGGAIGSTINAGTGTLDDFNSALGVGVSGSLSLSNLSNFDSYDHLSGDLTLTGSRNGGAVWTFATGTTLNLEGSLINTTGTGYGITAAAGATVNVLGTGVLDNWIGIYFNGGATSAATNSGAINGQSTGIFSTSGRVNFTNNVGGTVSTSGASGGVAIALASGGGTIVNNGTVSAVTNALTSSNTGIGGSASSLTNAGTLEGISAGLVMTGTGAFNVTNTSSINGSAVGTGVGVSQSAGTVTVANNSGGTISGNGYAVNTTGGSLALTNASGATISGGSVASIQAATSGAATIDLQAGSTTTGDVILSGTGARTVTIAGAFNGFLNATGNSGAVNLTLNTSATGYSLLEAGSGADTLTFAGSGSRTFSVDNLTNWDTGAFTGGAWTLTGTGNGTSFTSGLTVNGAALTVSNTLQLQGATGVTLTGGGSITTTASLSNTRTLAMTGAGSLGAASGQTLTQSGVVSGAGVLSLNGPGTVVLSGNNTYTGGTVVNSGILRLSHTSAAGTGLIRMIDPQIDFAAAGTYNNDISLEVVDGQQAADPTILNNTSGGAITLAGRIYETAGVGGAGQYVTFNGGSITLTNSANSWAGVTRINSGATLLGTTGTISGASIVNNGTLTYQNVSAGTASQNISGSGAININGTGVTLAGAITTTGQLTISGPGSSLILGGSRSGASNTGVVLSATGGSLTVANGASLQSGQYNGVRVISANASITNLGLLQNAGTGGDGTVGAGVYVLNGGLGGTTTVNNGSITDTGAGSTIQGRNAGVRHESGSTDLLVVNNYGLIVGDLYNGVENTAGGLTVNNFSGGYIATVLGNGVSSASASAVSVTNAGVIGRNIAGTVTVNGYGVTANGVLTLNNQAGGAIYGTLGGVQTNAAGASITNTGGIFGDTGSAISLAAGGSIVNGGSGLTAGQNTASLIDSGGASAIAVTNGAFSLQNHGRIIAAGSGVQIGSGGAYTGAVTIDNAGLIQGSSADGVRLNGAATVNNLSGGTITGSVAGLRLNGAHAYTLNLNAGSTVNGAIDASLSSGANTTVLGGVLNGAYSGGSGSDAFTLASTGAMTGASLGAGADSFTYQGGSFSGLLDGGADADSFVSNLSGGSASLNLSNLDNFETFAHQSGALTLTGTGAFSGGSSVTGGSLIVNGALQSDLGVAAGAALSGGGTIDGLVSVADGASLNGTQGSTLTMGDLLLGSGSTINATFSGAGGPALFAVSGDLVLDGTVNVASTGAYGFGVYGLMTYGGLLTDNGLAIGTTPGGAQRVQVQTSVAGQVNIVHAPTELLFWDGGNGAQHDNGAVNGGSGVWTAAGSEWTDANGLFNGAMEPQPGFAIFQGAGGTVTVDDVNGAVGVTGMQFAANGYRIEGDSITLANAGTTVRVGDGTAPGAAWAAAIASSLTGTGGLVKTDLGTLILAGDNDYTGGTTVNAGTLQIGEGGASGSILGSVVLANNSTLIFSRTDDYDFTNAVSGAGAVRVNGVVTLSGAITASSGVNVGAGSTATLSNVSVANGAAVTAGLDATVNLIQGGAIGSQNGTGVFVSAANGSVNNAGSITATTNAVYSSGALTLTNASTGSISGAFAVGALQNLNLTNDGAISASVTNFNSSGIYAGGTGTISNTGTITSGTNAIYTQGAGALTNSGLIQGGGAASTVRLFGANSSVTNLAAGEITTTGTGAGLYLDGVNANVVNSGTIRGGNAVTFVRSGGVLTNDGVLIGTTASGVVGNGGTIIANLTGGSITGATNGVNIVTGAGNLTNDGAITGGSGQGVLLQAGGSIANTGDITGAQSGVRSLAALTLSNAGSISGSVNAIETVGVFSDSLTFLAGSTTTGAVLTSGGDDAISLAGALNGLLNAGDGADTVTLIDTASVTSTLDGGDGVDAFGLGGAGTGSIDIGSVLNFESRAKNGVGVWTLTGVDASTVGWALNDGVLQLSGGSAVNDAADVTIGAGGTLALLNDETIGALVGSGFVDLGASVLTLGGAQTSVYGGVIGGAGDLEIGAAHSLTLTGANTYTGWTVVDGVLTLGAAGVLADGSALLVGSTGAVDLQGFDETVDIAFIEGALNGSGTLTAFEYDLDGATINANLGSGALFNLGGVSTLNGLIGADLVSVDAGTLVLGASNRLADTAVLGVATGATFDLGAFDDTIDVAILEGTLAGAGTLTASLYGLAGATVNANLGAGVLINIDGTSTLNGTSAADLVAVLDGTLALGASDRIVDTADLQVGPDGAFDLGAFDETVNVTEIYGTLAGTGTLTAIQHQLDGATVNANLAGGSVYVVGGASTLNGVSGADLLSVLGGSLTLGASDRIADTATLGVSSGAVLDMGAFDETVAFAGLSGTVNGAGTLTAAGYDLNGATINANLGAGDLFNTGGVSTLNGTSGAANVAVQAGTLALGASNRLADNATVSVASGATLSLGAFNDTVGLALLSGALAGTGTLTAGEYDLNGAAINANLGAGNLFNVGGVSTLTGTSGAANVVVQAGTLALGASDRLADTATVSVASGATLNLNAFNDTVGLAVINGTLNGGGTLTAAQYQLNAATVNANLGAGTLFNLGGVSTLNGTAAASQVQINAGTLRLGANERLSDAATVQVASGATLNVNGFNERIGALFGTGDVNVGAGRLTFGGAESGFGGRLSGTGSVVHTGGLFTLTGNHAISSISNTGGELRFGGTTTGGLSASGGSVTGAGTIGGALTASNGAILSPGLAGVQNGIGGFIAGGLTLNGATLAIDVLGTSGGNLIDQLRINGAATLTGGVLAPTFQGSAATDFNFSTRYLFLQANNLVGTFANGSSFTAAAQEGLFWRVRYDLAPNAAVLELRELTNFDPGTTGTGNQRSVGQALSGGQLLASDDWAATLALIAGLNAADRAAAFDSISGEPLADVTTSLFSANDSFINAVRDGGLNGRDDGGEALNFVDRLSFAGGSDNSADRLGDVLGAFDPSASTDRGAGGWVSAYAGDQTLEGKPGQATVESRLNGFAGGYGSRIGAMSIGAAGGVTRLEGDVAARQGHYESDLSHAAGYVAYDDGLWAADLTASFYGGDLDTRRGITVGAFHGQAIGNTHVEGQALSASVARRFQVSDNTMIALGAIGTASNASVDGFTETGAGGLSLTASGQERDWQSLQISARGTQDYRVNGQGFRLYAGAGVMAMAGDRQATGDMRFSGAPIGFGSFTVEGAEAPPVAGLADFGMEVGAGEGVTLSAGYRGLFSERLQDNQVGVKLKVSW